MKVRFTTKLRSAAYVALALAILAVLTVVASPSAQAQTFTSIYSFTGSTDGSTPFANVIMDKAGHLYGTTFGGGSAGAGTVYKLTKSGKETVLYNFTGGADGSEPFAGLVMDKAGNLYGTAVAGGSGFGTVFQVNPKTKTQTVLYTFTGAADGSGPFSGLVMDKAGNLYGTTVGGGSAGSGTVYKVNISSKTETVLHSFTGGTTDGAAPLYGYLLMDKAGNLYGTTVSGGSSSSGTVFEVTAKGVESVLYNFTGGADGAGAFEQSLAMSPTHHNLYGTTEEGGTHGGGVVFKLNAKTKKETVLYNFTGSTDGGSPSSGLVRDSKGNLFGTTQIGGANSDGVAFKVTGTTETVLHSFAGTDGSNPFTSPLLDHQGTLYGSTYAGGADGHGTIFSIKP